MQLVGLARSKTGRVVKAEVATRLFCEQRPSIPKRLGLFGLPRRGSAGSRDRGCRKRSIENRERAL